MIFLSIQRIGLMQLRQNNPSRKRYRETAALRASKFTRAIVPKGANTPLTTLLKETKNLGASRRNLEKARVQAQCEAILKMSAKQKCWLCGFRIGGMESKVRKGFLYSKYLDSHVCEHVLPVRLAFFITGLYTEKGLAGIFDDKDLLHTEYEYAHHYCNMVKSEDHFITKTDNQENWCGLEINQAKIDAFLTNLYGSFRRPSDRRSPIVSNIVDEEESGIFVKEGLGHKRVYDNIVQCYVNELEGGDIEGWKRATKEKIMSKMNGFLEKVKEKDHCGKPLQGMLYQESTRRREELAELRTVRPVYGPSSAYLARASSYQEQYESANNVLNNNEYYNNESNNESPISLPNQGRPAKRARIRENNGAYFGQNVGANVTGAGGSEVAFPPFLVIAANNKKNGNMEGGKTRRRKRRAA